MESETVTGTIRQYSLPLSRETLDFLRGVAEDCGKVKNSTYRRYSGVRSMERLSSVYEIMNEMRRCGLRERLNLPSVYYELAVAEAVSDLKSAWGVVKNGIRTYIHEREDLSDDDRHYIRMVLNRDGVLSDVLNRRPRELPEEMQNLCTDRENRDNLIRRLVRKYHVVPEADGGGPFRVSANGYRYGDGGIYLTGRVPRRRIFLPLRDATVTDRQIQICVRREDAVLVIPVEREIVRHEDYKNTIFVHIGYRDMITLSNGNTYGEGLSELVEPGLERMAEKNRNRAEVRAAYRKSLETGNTAKAERIRKNNLGKQKYDAGKRRENEKVHNFINASLNRMLEAEKPERIVISRTVVKNKKKYRGKEYNRRLAGHPEGYVRERLKHKCEKNGIELTELIPKGTAAVCSVCGAEGSRTAEGFTCGACGYRAASGVNAAKNLENLYRRRERERDGGE